MDALAVAIGMAHDACPKGKVPKLDSERLHRLRETLGILLVLHGSSGSGEENLGKTVAGGTDKIDAYTDAFEAGKVATLKLLEENLGADYLHMYMVAETGIRRLIKDYMKVIGSNGCYTYDEEVTAGNE